MSAIQDLVADQYRERRERHPLGFLGSGKFYDYGDWEAALKHFLDPEHFSFEIVRALLQCGFEVDSWDSGRVSGFRGNRDGDRIRLYLTLADGFRDRGFFIRRDEQHSGDRAPADSRHQLARIAMEGLCAGCLNEVTRTGYLSSFLTPHLVLQELLNFFDPLDGFNGNIPLQHEQSSPEREVRVFLAHFCTSLLDWLPDRDGFVDIEKPRIPESMDPTKTKLAVLGILRCIGKLRLLLAPECSIKVDEPILEQLKMWALSAPFRLRSVPTRTSCQTLEAALASDVVEAVVYSVLRAREAVERRERSL